MNRRVVVPAVLVWLASAVGVVPQAAGPRAQSAATTSPDYRAVLTNYCASCHNERAKTGGLALDGMDLSKIAEGAEVWEKVVRKVRAGLMPPAGMPRPDPATAEGLASWLETTLDRAAAAAPHPGMPALRRLNRAEYANAIRDLFALDVDTSVLLPPDDSSSGFDNNADVLGVSPALLEKYLSAAKKISALAIGDVQISASTETYRTPPDITQTQHVDGLPLGTRGGLVVRHTFPLDGEYVLKVKLLETTLGAIRGLEFRHQVDVLLDGERVHEAEVGGAADFVETAVNATTVLNDIGTRLTVRLKVKAGPRAVAATFRYRSAALGGGRLESFQRANVDTTEHLGLPHIESLTILGPYNATGSGETPSRQRTFVCRPAKPVDEPPCARRIVSTIARRAYRRPVTEAEVDRLLAFYEAGRRAGSFDTGIERALRSVLASPSFVFRLEHEPGQTPAGTAYRLTDLELASRLSFFLWSSIPDDELVDVASRGQLKTPAVLEHQVRRMLADPRASTLMSNFAGQWLQLRNLRATIPDQNDFPDFDDNLRQAFRRETELLFESIVSEDRSVLDLLTADYTFVNERLARHYRIPNIYGSHFRRVTLTDETRKGLLGKGAILTVTSHPDRTSPVLRGKWVLENLLGTPPPPPPPDVPALVEGRGAKPRSVREQMEVHRASPSCAGCHKLMDPIGFAMENFDAVGGWRDRDAGAPINAAGQLTDGTDLNGVVTLRQALLKRPGVIVGTMTEKLLTYALGRGLDYHDQPAVRAIVKRAGAGEYRFSSLILGIVTSTPFQMRTKASQGRERTSVTASSAR